MTAIVVHYGEPQATVSAVNDLPADLPVIVVDNGPTPGTVEARLRHRPGTKVLASPDNLGFARAANLGAAQADSELLLFVNADASPTRSDLTMLRAILDQKPDAGAVGPAFVDARGRVELAGGGMQPAIRSALLHALTSGWIGQGSLQIRPRAARTYAVEWVAGTCLLVRREAFLVVGGFDEGYPLYCEDMALGQRLRRTGWRLVVDGAIRVPHVGGGSVGQSPWLWHSRGSALGYYIRRTAGGPRSHTIRTVLWTGYVARAALLWLRSSSRPRAKEMWWYAQGIRRSEAPTLPQ